jgi:hypothetical protein
MNARARSREASIDRPLREQERYRREEGYVVIEVAVSKARQLFNEKDPAPFRERDLDEDFVEYISSSVQEFPLNTAMRLRIIVTEEAKRLAGIEAVQRAIRAYFHYEAMQAQAKLRKRMRIARLFLFIGLGALVACLGISQAMASLGESPVIVVAREGFLIAGWVAMWRPIEVFLYDWWPLREQRKYMQKISEMDLTVRYERGGHQRISD